MLVFIGTEVNNDNCGQPEI